MQITQIPNLVRLETRGANAEGEGAVEISDLIRASLRMRPNYLIVGEVRGKECLDMLQALNTGHFGLSTGHGNSARDMLSRLETMTLMAADIPPDCGAGADCLCDRYSGASRQAEGQKPAGAGNYGSNRIRGGRDSVKSALPV